jgi:hypothetical protein
VVVVVVLVLVPVVVVVVVVVAALFSLRGTAGSTGPGPSAAVRAAGRSRWRRVTAKLRGF